MSNQKRLVAYVSEDVHGEVEQIAEQQGVSMSDWVRSAVTEKIDREKERAYISNYDLEQRLLDLVETASGQAADQLADELADDLADELADDLSEDIRVTIREELGDKN